MKKIKYILLATMAASLILSACGKSEKPQEKGAAATQSKEVTSEESKLKVMASFYTMYDFAKKVGGDKVDVKNMVPAGTEPHDWEPAATDIKNLEDADVFIYNGVDMEHWTEEVLDSLDNRSLKVVEAARGISLIKGEDHDEDKDHDKDDQDKDEHDEDGHDPHVWLNPLNAKAEMENIKNALVEADPKNKAYYTENYDKYAKELDQLDAEYKKELEATKSKNIITAHEAFGYLCSAYGLNQVGIEGLSPDSEPEPSRMNEIIGFAKAQGVKTIFFEELVNPKVAETIAKEIGAKVEVLNPLEGLSEEEEKAGDDYFSVMKANLKKLKAALNE